MKRKSPIGVFDSGIGGLTVLDELIEQFPHEDFIYIADTKNCPYGEKSAEDIAELVTRVSSYLIENKVKAIVIACNTATANSNHLLEITDIPIIGVIEPTAQYALKATKNKKVAVLATIATIESNLYQNLLNKILRFKKAKVYPVKCSEFVLAVEGNQLQCDYSYNLVKDKLMNFENEHIDTVILGCTHFGLIKEEISAVFKDANLISSGKPTGEYLRKVLKRKNILNLKVEPGTVSLNTTGDPIEMAENIKWFKKPYQGINKIKV